MRILITALLLQATYAYGALCVQPKIIDPDADCCSYNILDQAAGLTERYRQPGHVFNNSTEAHNFYKNLRPRMPFRLPHGSGVKLNGAWQYNGGGYHAALDYSKTTVANGADPTFPVVAVAPGRVIAAYWDDWFGNTVILEHRAPNGSIYRSLYLHVRNGFNNDLNMARNLTIPSDDATNSNRRKYVRYANLANPSTKQWGKNSQRIPVTVGQSEDDGDAGEIGDPGGDPEPVAALSQDIPPSRCRRRQAQTQETEGRFLQNHLRDLQGRDHGQDRKELGKYVVEYDIGVAGSLGDGSFHKRPFLDRPG